MVGLCLQWPQLTEHVWRHMEKVGAGCWVVGLCLQREDCKWTVWYGTD